MRYADVFIFDMKKKKWSKKQCKGEQPKDLCYAIGWYDTPNFFFYGGRNKELSLSDTYFLNTEKWISRTYKSKVKKRMHVTNNEIQISKGIATKVLVGINY